MTSSNQPPRLSGPARVAEPARKRPLPTGVVGLSPLGGVARPDRRESAPSGTLIVGQGIQVKGTIESCRTLVVEGRVEASLEADALEVLEGGLFTGTATVGKADVAGTVDGTLIVREQLSIAASGRAFGKIRYARLAVEKGGEIGGDVDVGTGQDGRVGMAPLTVASS